MRESYQDRGHRKQGAASIRSIEEGLRAGRPADVAFGIGKKGVEGSARDGGRAIAERMYRRGDGIPLPPSVFVDIPDVAPNISAKTGVFEVGGILVDPGMTQEEIKARLRDVGHFPSMQARVSDAEIPPTVVSDQLN